MTFHGDSSACHRGFLTRYSPLRYWSRIIAVAGALLSRPPGAVGSVERFICSFCTRPRWSAPGTVQQNGDQGSCDTSPSCVALLQRLGAARCEGGVADSGGTDLDAPWSGSLKKISPCVQVTSQ